MKALLCMLFQKKKEWTGTGDYLVVKPLGDFLVTFLSTDFNEYLEEIYDCKTPNEAEEAHLRVKNKVSAIHILFENYLIPTEIEDSPLLALKRRLELLKHIQTVIRPLAHQIFFEDDSGLTPMQRLCRLLSEDQQAAALFVQNSEFLRTERSIYINGKHFQPMWDHLAGDDLKKEIICQLVYGCDDMQTMLLLEIQEMATQSLHLKACAYCGKYFAPFSSKSIYCDRLVGDTGKTCQQIAAKLNHEKKIACNAGLTLYRKRNKAYAMRVSRAPAVYTDEEYQKWKADADTALENYLDGVIDLECLDMLIQLPARK